MDRDENSARNILNRYLARLEPYTLERECDVVQGTCVDVGIAVMPQPCEVQQLDLW